MQGAQRDKHYYSSQAYTRMSGLRFKKNTGESDGTSKVENELQKGIM